MLVDVVELRRQGRRLHPDLVRAAAPVRGVLTLTPVRAGWYPGKRNAPLFATLVQPDIPNHVLEPLDQARVARIDRGAMLIVGLQQYVRPVRVLETVRQAWWVRPAEG